MERRKYLSRGQPCYVYLIQLTADRIKVGITEEQSAAGRLTSAKPWVPDAEVIRTWPAFASWEPIAFAWIEYKFDLDKLGNETYGNVRDIRAVEQEIDNLMQRLPQVDVEKAQAFMSKTVREVFLREDGTPVDEGY